MYIYSVQFHYTHFCTLLECCEWSNLFVLVRWSTLDYDLRVFDILCGWVDQSHAQKASGDTKYTFCNFAAQCQSIARCCNHWSVMPMSACVCYGHTPASAVIATLVVNHWINGSTTHELFLCIHPSMLCMRLDKHQDPFSSLLYDPTSNWTSLPTLVAHIQPTDPPSL